VYTTSLNRCCGKTLRQERVRIYAADGSYTYILIQFISDLGIMGGSSSSIQKPTTPIIKMGWLTKKVPTEFDCFLSKMPTCLIQGAVVENMKRRFFVLHSDCA
jgi:hypothetical protein